MIYIILLSAIILILVFLPLLKGNKQSKDSLLGYIISLCKKRNLEQEKVKNSIKTSNCDNKKPKFKDKIKYKKLKHIAVKNSYKSLLKEKNKTYVEMARESETRAIYSICPMIEEKINHSSTHYRAINGQTIIETVASCYADDVLVMPTFDMFENFASLIKMVKVYKKEAEILNILVISRLMILYLRINEDIKRIKKDIKRGAKNINYKSTPASIYGKYMFSGQSSRCPLTKGQIISAVNSLLFELDHLSEKQRIIFNYIKYLYKGIV